MDGIKNLLELQGRLGIIPRIYLPFGRDYSLKEGKVIVEGTYFHFHRDDEGVYLDIRTRSPVCSPREKPFTLGTEKPYKGRADYFFNELNKLLCSQ